MTNLQIDDNNLDYSLSMADANLKSVWVVVPVLGLYLFLNAWLWGWNRWVEISELFLSRYWISLFLILFGIMIHEALHAAAWSWFGNKRWSAFTFGFSLMGFAPYAHCAEPMSVSAYRKGVVAPGIVLGIIPFVLGLSFGEAWMTGFGFLFTLVASGDFLMLWIIRGISPGDTMVQDHPERVGCVVVQGAD